jgi:hypothetical protein
MLATCDGFLLFLHNMAFGKVSERNGFIRFVDIQFLSSVSWVSKIVAFQLIKSSATKFLFWISMDDGTFGCVPSSSGFKVETDVGINGCFAPFLLLGTHCLNLASWSD